MTIPAKTIPPGWREFLFSEVCEKALNGGTPSTKEPPYWNGSIPWITGADIINQQIGEIRRFVSKEGVANSATNVIPKGNILLVTRTGLGKIAIAPYDIAISQDITGVIVKPGFDTHFLYWLLNQASGFFSTLNQGTSINGIIRKDLMNYSFICPISDIERKEIASIISTIDENIKITQSIINQAEKLKRGLMQQLLTKGIDKNGQIRNERTHKFKDSPVGRIPIEWDFCKCGEILNLKRGYDLPTKERVPGKIPVYSSAGVTGYHESYKVKGPGIVTGRYGTIGDVFLVNEDFWPLNTTLYVTDIKGNDIVFLSYLLKSILEAYQNDAHSIPGINRNYVHRVLTIIPPKDEQIQIGILLTEIDKKIVFEGNFLKSLLQLNNRLSSDLLTGRVRVPLPEVTTHDP